MSCTSSPIFERAYRHKSLPQGFSQGHDTTGVLGAASVIRPGNVLISAVAVLIGAVVGAGIGILWPLSVTLLLAAIVAALFTAAGNALNDYFDAETDARNHPERPK